MLFAFPPPDISLWSESKRSAASAIDDVESAIPLDVAVRCTVLFCTIGPSDVLNSFIYNPHPQIKSFLVSGIKTYSKTETQISWQIVTVDFEYSVNFSTFDYSTPSWLCFDWYSIIRIYYLYYIFVTNFFNIMIFFLNSIHRFGNGFGLGLQSFWEGKETPPWTLVGPDDGLLLYDSEFGHLAHFNDRGKGPTGTPSPTSPTGNGFLSLVWEPPVPLSLPLSVSLCLALNQSQERSTERRERWEVKCINNNANVPPGGGTRPNQ